MEATTNLLASWGLLAADYIKTSGSYMVFSVNHPTGKVLRSRESADYLVSLERESVVLVALYETGRSGGLVSVSGVPER